ncbi:nuclear transport factor 2 family protein [Streptomyces cucumeris]|uniref:nuclear transport factor 2 family protein n=1 Tax=Streptomyces TaxID=1883 RepID=UPI0020C8D0A4|nr:nuclear transport factor 2 family protein [Streptomyces sp. NEAU-Y11]MCP9209252.1 nuclear transport factor 2 family protein [Streptomyces sp. NEAU-Y11]
MAEHPDCALVRRAFEAFIRGDMDTLSTFMTSDVVHHVPGDNTMSGHHKGLEACIRLYRQWGSPDGSSKAIEPEMLTADGRGHVIFGYRYRARSADGSRSFDMKAAQFITVIGGKISDIDECVEDIDALNAYWR